MATTLYYFAYGSNMHPARLRRRVPSCHPLGTVRLSGFALRFHKRGQDGSAKCNAFHTGRDSDQVIGVVYTMAAAHRPRLDQAEGLGKGYHRHNLPVTAAGGKSIFLYLADPAYIDDALRPFDWYRDLVLEGARRHRLPSRYIRKIAAVAAAADPDPVRADLHRRILAEPPLPDHEKSLTMADFNLPPSSSSGYA